MFTLSLILLVPTSVLAQLGVHICTQPNFTGNCTYYPSIPPNDCQTSIKVGYDYSFGPDLGIICMFNEKPYCGSGMTAGGMGYPGIPNVRNYLNQSNWSVDSAGGQLGSWICEASTDGGGS